LKWIKDWLTDRKQWVSVNGFMSNEANVSSGVPQGSVLGPILFIIYINDIDDMVEEIIEILRKFADDTKLAKMIKNSSDRNRLQECLDKLCEWGRLWSMEFNTKKCKVLHFGRQNPKYEYSMNGEILACVENERDIGIKITSNLKPSEHCQEAVGKARSVLGQISRCFHYRDKHVFLRLYLQYVRPHLEFSSAAWSPWLTADITALEQVQSKAIGMISGIQARDYPGKLKELSLWSLEKRRIMLDLMQMYKIVYGIGNIKCSVNLVKDQRRAQSVRATRSQTDELNIIKERCKLDVRKNFFTNRVADTWNLIPSHIKQITPVYRFKKHLIDWMNKQRLTEQD
jgi:ribonucleases P/MRP protein subunit RPP40